MKAYLCLGCQTKQVHVTEPKRCMNPRCKAGAAYLKEELALPGFEGSTAERERERAKTEREAMERTMRERAGDVSAKAGNIERDSPLFRGTGENPLLF
jgi:hypothetical protein